MAIKYCDFKNGNDITGNGTNTNPFKTITRACQGLGGGDEVRVAKSIGMAYVGGNITFTSNSYNISSSHDIFINEISTGGLPSYDGKVRLGDFILGPDNNWYEVIYISNSKNAWILHRPGSSGSVPARMLLTTDTGKGLPGIYTQEIEEGYCGDSPNNRLKISGGWDLLTETQTGYTYFRQLDPNSLLNKEGVGLYSGNNSYLQIERLAFLRYNNGFIFLNCNNLIENYCYGFGNKNTGLLLGYCLHNKIYNSNFSNNGFENSEDDGVGISLVYSSNIEIKNTECSNNYGYTGIGILLLFLL